MSAFEIVRVLATQNNPLLYIQEHRRYMCGLCGTIPAYKKAEDIRHEDNCAWKMARDFLSVEAMEV